MKNSATARVTDLLLAMAKLLARRRMFSAHFHLLLQQRRRALLKALAEAVAKAPAKLRSLTHKYLLLTVNTVLPPDPKELRNFNHSCSMD
jgi:small-conductance mechanosensitive channel